MEKETDRLVKEIEQLIRHEVCHIVTGASNDWQGEPVRRLIDCWMERTSGGTPPMTTESITDVPGVASHALFSAEIPYDSQPKKTQ